MNSTLKKTLVAVGALVMIGFIGIRIGGAGSVGGISYAADTMSRFTGQDYSQPSRLFEVVDPSTAAAADHISEITFDKLVGRLSQNLTELQDRLTERDRAFSQKLDDIRNIALADLELQDTIETLAHNFSQFQQRVDHNNKELLNKIDLVDSGQGTNRSIPPPPSRKLDKNLLILVGSAGLIYAQQKIEESHPNSKMHRDMFFGGRGRDVNIKNENLFDVCPPGCEFTTDASRFREADVVILYAGADAYRALEKANQTILRAHPDQRFVYHYFEQPHNFIPADLTTINQRVGVNWTVHYQQDATVFWPYGSYRRRTNPIGISANYAASKKRKVIWVVSRCQTLFSHREQYVAELIKYIDIDVYGKCIDDTPSRVPMDVNSVAQDYKFFISFENGDCDDYITEKFFRYAKDVSIVPIVLGRRNHYEQLAPDRSYIQADQFDSPRQLAAYLHALDKDDSLYQQYFEWRKNFIMDYMPRPVCTMCNIFRAKWFEPSIIDMHKYHGFQRCWKANRNLASNFMQKIVSLTNYTFTDPWLTIKQLNSRNQPLRFP